MIKELRFYEIDRFVKFYLKKEVRTILAGSRKLEHEDIILRRLMFERQIRIFVNTDGDSIKSALVYANKDFDTKTLMIYGLYYESIIKIKEIIEHFKDNSINFILRDYNRVDKKLEELGSLIQIQNGDTIYNILQF